jgi:hypothetical protein
MIGGGSGLDGKFERFSRLTIWSRFGSRKIFGACESHHLAKRLVVGVEYLSQRLMLYNDPLVLLIKMSNQATATLLGIRIKLGKVLMNKVVSFGDKGAKGLLLAGDVRGISINLQSNADASLGQSLFGFCLRRLAVESAVQLAYEVTHAGGTKLFLPVCVTGGELARGRAEIADEHQLLEQEFDALKMKNIASETGERFFL